MACHLQFGKNILNYKTCIKKCTTKHRNQLYLFTSFLNKVSVIGADYLTFWWKEEGGGGWKIWPQQDSPSPPPSPPTDEQGRLPPEISDPWLQLIEYDFPRIDELELFKTFWCSGVIEKLSTLRMSMSKLAKVPIFKFPPCMKAKLFQNKN